MQKITELVSSIQIAKSKLITYPNSCMRNSISQLLTLVKKIIEKKKNVEMNETIMHNKGTRDVQFMNFLLVLVIAIVE